MLLGTVNAIVGLIVCYYFSRATSEARAEHAEKVNISDARFALDTLLRAAEPLVSQSTDIVDRDDAGARDAATHARLQLAMEVARNILSNRRLR